MKPKTMILMGVAIVCGLGASYMTSRLLAERENQQPEVVEVPKVTVLVAKKTLDGQTLIKKAEDFFIEKEFTKDQAPANAVVKYADLKGKFLRNRIRAGDHVTPDDLLESQTVLQVPAGMVAIGFRVGVEDIAGGFASLPGSRVDLIWMCRRGGDDTTYAQVLLQDVIVLAADQEKGNDGSGLPRVASVITVALNHFQALKLKLASQMGPISLVLRKYDDRNMVDTHKVTVKELLSDNSTSKNGGTTEPSSPEIGPFAGGGKGVNPLPPIPMTEPGVEKPTPEPKQEPQKYFHFVKHKRGDKTWVEKIEVDAQGNPLGGENGQQPSAEESPRVEPRPTPQAPKPPVAPKNNDFEPNGKKRIDL